MTSHEVKVLEDGTRVYACHNRYRLKPVEDRKIGIRKPDDPRAVRFYGDWYAPLDLADYTNRVMPETRPDTDAYDHMELTLNCRCDVCARPAAERWRRKWLREQGIRKKIPR